MIAPSSSASQGDKPRRHNNSGSQNSNNGEGSDANANTLATLDAWEEGAAMLEQQVRVRDRLVGEALS